MTDERGQLGGLEGLAFGVLVFVMGTLIVVNAWAVIDAKLAASAAAREAARTYVESPPDEADGAAVEAAGDALEGHGRDRDRMNLRHTSGAYGRCRRVTFSVRYPVPLAAIPLIGRRATVFVAVARHSEIIDPYRSGLPGEARCV